jgi:hypothetical protein
MSRSDPPHAGFFFPLKPWRWRWHFLSKRRLTLNRLHSITSQKTEFFSRCYLASIWDPVNICNFCSATCYYLRPIHSFKFLYINSDPAIFYNICASSWLQFDNEPLFAVCLAKVRVLANFLTATFSEIYGVLDKGTSIRNKTAYELCLNWFQSVLWHQ